MEDDGWGGRGKKVLSGLFVVERKGGVVCMEGYGRGWIDYEDG